MRRLAMWMLALTTIGAGVSYGQQVREVRPQPTRSYRSYSVSPSPRGNVRRDRTASDSTWRHADTKAGGQFHGGR